LNVITCMCQLSRYRHESGVTDKQVEQNLQCSALVFFHSLPPSRQNIWKGRVKLMRNQNLLLRT